MTGTIAANFHQGSRSEILADYLFSGWGAVTPVRGQNDFGVDLYCTLTEDKSRRGIVTDYYAVQVKSNTDPWVFSDEIAVRWLVQHPTPLFLACIDKSAGVLRVYHISARFYVWALGKLPSRLELRPEDVEQGEFARWEGGQSYSLSAPILRVELADFMDDEKLDRIREVFTRWVRIDQANCDRVRQGLLRFQMPDRYRVNEIPSPSIFEAGTIAPEHALLRRGILTAAEGAECVGGQLGELGDRLAALLAALFVDHLHRNHSDVFAGELRWNTRLPGGIGWLVRDGLNSVLEGEQPPSHAHQGLDDVSVAITSLPLVKRFLEASNRAQALP